MTHEIITAIAAALGCVAIGLAGGAVHRIQGGGWVKTPHMVPRIGLALAYAAPFIIAACRDFQFFYLVMAAAVVAVTALMVSTGHGGWQDMGTWNKPREEEKTEFLIAWLKPHLSPYWYDFTGMAVDGILITLTAGLVSLNPFLAVSGALQAPAYAIGWKIYPSGQAEPTGAGIDGLARATEIGEFLTGFFLWTALAACEVVQWHMN